MRKYLFAGLLSIIPCAFLALYLFCAKESPVQPHTENYTGTITGQVSDKHGNPLRNVFVSIDADSATPGISDVKGRFSVGQVKAGTHTLHFAHPDYEACTSHSIELKMGQAVEIKDTIDLAYAYYIIAGQILYNEKNGVPAAGVGVEGYPAYALAGSEGRYVIDKVIKKPELTLISAKTGIGFSTKTIKHFAADDTTWVDLELDSPGETIRGTVYDSAGKPLANVIVAAIGGGLVDTTNSEGRYELSNIPSGNAVRIYIPGRDEVQGSISGIKVNDGAFLDNIDITLRAPSTFTSGNGMALEVSDMIVADDDPQVTLSVVPHADSSTTIASYEWTLTGKDSMKTTTKMPYLSVATDSLVDLCDGAFPSIITAKVNAVNRDTEPSPARTFTIQVRSTTPTISAGVSAAESGKPMDSVNIDPNQYAWFTGKVTAPLGGIDSVAWSFGDGKPDKSSTDSLPVFGHWYDTISTFIAVFRVSYGGKNTLRDSVTVMVTNPALPLPVNASPKDSSIVAGSKMTLSWHPVSGTKMTYSVLFDSLNTYPTDAVVSSIADTFTNVTIAPHKTYFWRVVAISGSDTSRGEVWQFTTDTANTAIDTIGLKNGLVAYYPFNGNAKDESGNGNDGTVNGALPSDDRFNSPDKAYSFDSNYISIQPDSALDFSNGRNFTIGVWVKFSEVPISKTALVVQRDDAVDSRNELTFELNDGGAQFSGMKLRLCVYNNGTKSIDISDPDTDFVYQANVWWHLAVVGDNYTYRLFRNGAAVTSEATTQSVPKIQVPLLIGATKTAAGYTQFVNGSIDDVRIYNRALSPAEIDSLYHEGGWAGDVADADGNIYHTVRIGTQTWMTVNLKTTKYNDGSAIPLVAGNTEWPNLTTPGYCWYDNDTANAGTYGALYNWYAVNTGKLAPAGWHVATDAEWNILVAYLGDSSVAGSRLKETGTTHWASPNTGATNETGFSALPGGYRTNSSGEYYKIGTCGYWWLFDAEGIKYTWYLLSNETNVHSAINANMTDGFSVRCVRD